MVGRQACPQHSVLLAGVGHADDLHIRSHAAAAEGGRIPYGAAWHKTEAAVRDAMGVRILVILQVC